MKQFKSKSLLLLFLAMRMYLEENELFPKSIEIWQKEDSEEITANLYFCKWTSPRKSVESEEYESVLVIETVIAPDKCVTCDEMPDVPAVLLGKARDPKVLMIRTEQVLSEIKEYLMEHEIPDGV